MNSTSEDRAAALRSALQRLASGDQTALATIYEASAAKLFGICLRILGDRQEAEDALQEVYVQLWQRAGRFDADRGSPITWLATFARNRSIDRLRGRGVRQAAVPVEAASHVPDGAPDAETLIGRDQEQARLFGCLDGLEPTHAQAIRAAFFDGFTYAELAERGGVPLGTMKSWIRRSLARLKDCLEP